MQVPPKMKAKEKMLERQHTAVIVFCLCFIFLGLLEIESDYVYSWFSKHFKELIDLLDPEFGRSWTYKPSRQVATPQVSDDSYDADQHAATRKFNVIYGNKQAVSSCEIIIT